MNLSEIDDLCLTGPSFGMESEFVRKWWFLSDKSRQQVWREKSEFVHIWQFLSDRSRYRVRKVNLSEFDDFCLTGPGLGMEKWICPKMTIFVWQVQVYEGKNKFVRNWQFLSDRSKFWNGKVNLSKNDDFCPTSPGMEWKKWFCPYLTIFVWQVQV